MQLKTYICIFLALFPLPVTSPFISNFWYCRSTPEKSPQTRMKAESNIYVTYRNAVRLENTMAPAG